MSRPKHEPWCDVVGHTRDVKTTGAGPDQCYSASLGVIPGWDEGEDTTGWITTSGGTPEVITDLAAEGMCGLALTPAEAREVGRLLTEGSPEQLRAWGVGLLHFSALVEQERQDVLVG